VSDEARHQLAAAIEHSRRLVLDVHTVREIVLPETGPGTKWIPDRPVQKVLPATYHSIFATRVRDSAQSLGG
jgi:hypothetical protein